MTRRKPDTEAEMRAALTSTLAEIRECLDKKKYALAGRLIDRLAHTQRKLQYWLKHGKKNV